MADKIKSKRRFSFFFMLLFLVFGPSLSHAAKKRGPIILGIGAGYSFFLDSGLKIYEVYHPKLIFLSEQLNLRDNFHFYVQYFPWLGFGFQLEFDHQKAGYNCDLKWYGQLDSNDEIIEINHIEEPYKESWTLSSITASILYKLTLRSNEKIQPYISAGVGYYFSSGDEERFYSRTRLGPEKSGNMVKLGLGVRYQINPKIGINFRGVGGTIWRREYGFGEIKYLGPDQFDYKIYEETGNIVRAENLFVNSYTFLGIALSLEYTF
ncbi:MAG: autotransporter outer membrane beta-barrel domain-containing protein [Candidatus Aminicenantes bacterium]|nr:MAG: autotransporter outer membrane beta-barrel domain-containing protein [Candidatus Aminicenantes bacterium]